MKIVAGSARSMGVTVAD
ncbi:MAG: hypothetical protein LBL55_09480 [Propionibacteriaceae bacterium]|nr:hypothetical protein [Propionibacteriaceae bacterium]